MQLWILLRDHKMSDINNLQEVLDWLKTCPHKFSVSSLSNGHVFIKIKIPEDEVEAKENKDE